MADANNNVSKSHKYRKLPVVIDAMQLPPAEEDASEELKAFLHEMKENWESEYGGYVVIHTLEGDMVAKPGDWIIRGVNGEYYPCANDVFQKTYVVAWETTMTQERLDEIIKNPEADLTMEEHGNGWHFCYDWDGLLVNRYDTEGEGQACTCYD